MDWLVDFHQHLDGIHSIHDSICWKFLHLHSAEYFQREVLPYLRKSLAFLENFSCCVSTDLQLPDSVNWRELIEGTLNTSSVLARVEATDDLLALTAHMRTDSLKWEEASHILYRMLNAHEAKFNTVKKANSAKRSRSDDNSEEEIVTKLKKTFNSKINMKH